MTARHSLDEIVRGLDGVTAGPWRVDVATNGRGHIVDFGEPPSSPFMMVYEGKPSTSVMKGWPANGVCHSDDGSSEANAAHIARCSPDAIREIAAYVRDLEERLAKAAVALEPFMERAKRFDEIPGVYLCHDNVELWQDGNWRCDLTVGDLRRARTALSQIRSEK